QAILDEVDRQLSDLDLTAGERNEITKPYVDLIGVDLHQIVLRLFDRYAHWKDQDLRKRVQTNRDEEARAGLQKLGHDVSIWRSRIAARGGPFARLKNCDLAEELEILLPIEWLNERDVAGARALTNLVSSLFANCRKAGFTPEAAEFYDKHHDDGGIDAK